MLCLLSPFTDAYLNLAAEEYYFKNSSSDLLFLYINEPAIVVGKHQNAMAEINYGFVKKNGVKVVRRISGGGAVYHDGGNLNFSFHKTVDDPSKVSFKIFNEPIVQVLQQMGIPAEISNRNDIKVNGFKVSGHAEHVFRNRILSHGTLLFDSKKEDLSKALKSKEVNFQGKAIKSVRSKVANITDFMDKKTSINSFIQQLLSYFENELQATIIRMSSAEIEEIEKLANEKYKTWEWNFGYSPKFTFSNSIELNGKQLNVEVFVEKGIMTNIVLTGTFGNTALLKSITEAVLNKPHQELEIQERLSAINSALTKLEIEKIASLFLN